MAISNSSKAGAAIFVGAVQFGIGIILGEVYYPGYSVMSNTISDLGADCAGRNPNNVFQGISCNVYQPASIISNASVIVLGLLVLVGAFYMQKAFNWKPGTGLIALAGLGAIGVGVFPETFGLAHDLFSLIVFLFAGLSAIALARFQRKPMFYFSIILGFVTLVSLVLYIGGENLGLGTGGMERMVVYPSLLWAIGFGGHLMATDEKPMP